MTERVSSSRSRRRRNKGLHLCSKAQETQRRQSSSRHNQPLRQGSRALQPPEARWLRSSSSHSKQPQRRGRALWLQEAQSSLRSPWFSQDRLQLREEQRRDSSRHSKQLRGGGETALQPPRQAPRALNTNSLSYQVVRRISQRLSLSFGGPGLFWRWSAERRSTSACVRSGASGISFARSSAWPPCARLKRPSAWRKSRRSASSCWSAASASARSSSGKRSGLWSKRSSGRRCARLTSSGCRTGSRIAGVRCARQRSRQRSCS
mmetsp:Transcript_90193/g.156303  ORF Transcript_90193/g.156303 Transcript_90193/m.156303 type:complete len:263 (-) Transcript_90193:674-1462(-)